MKRGDVVRCSKPVNEEEARFRFILLNEPEEGRVDIQLICDERIKPFETVEVEEVEVVREPRRPDGEGQLTGSSGY